MPHKAGRLLPTGFYFPPHGGQTSVLTIHPDPLTTCDSDSLVRLDISSKLAPDLKANLRRCGIHPVTLFPDLDGLEKLISYEG